MAGADNSNRLSGPKKAAMALLAMGEEASAMILKKLSTDEIKELSVHMSNIEGVKKETSNELLQEFTSLFKVEGGLSVDGNQFIRSLLPSVMQRDQANEVISKIDEEKLRTPFKHLRRRRSQTARRFYQG